MVILQSLLSIRFKLAPRRLALLATALLLGLSAFGHSAAAALNVSVDRNPINLQDTVQIVIEATESVSGNPDLSALKADFELLGISQSSSYQFGTGGSQRSIKRIVTAQPKRAGLITLPAITWDKLRSQPLTLKVLDSPQASAATGSPFYVEMSASEREPYVQGQVILTIKAFSQRPFSQGAFQNPELPPGLVAKQASSEDQVYQTRINGVAYVVQERRLILYAERSGQYELGGALFQGHFRTGQRDIFGQYSLAPKRARSNGLSLNVKAIPDTARRPWLPARQITLSHYLSEGDYQIGEPITLTLSVIADGLMAEQIPDLSLHLPEGLKAYPDQPETDTHWSDGQVTAKRTDKMALIPTRGGDFQIPAIELHWWNTDTDQAETARIDGIRIHVNGALPAAAPAQTTANPAADDIPAAPPGSVADTANAAGQRSSAWVYASLVFASLWLITLAVLLIQWRHWPRRSAPKAAASAAPMEKKQLLKQLQKASAAQAAEQLVVWARDNIDPAINSVGQLIPQVDEPLQQALQQLNASLYSANSGHWQSAPLIKALRRFKPRSNKPQPNRPDTRLYPDSERH